MSLIMSRVNLILLTLCAYSNFAYSLMYSGDTTFNSTSEYDGVLVRRGNKVNYKNLDLQSLSTIPQYMATRHVSKYNKKIESWDGINPALYYHFNNDYVLGRGSFGTVYRVEFRLDRIRLSNAADFYKFPQFAAMKNIIINDYNSQYSKQTLSSNSVNSYIEAESSIVEEVKIMRSLWSTGVTNKQADAAGRKNILKFYDSFKWQSNYYIALEYMEFGSLSTFLGMFQKYGVTFAEANVAWICHEALKGLSYLHDHRIVHRDIKPDNILIGGSGEIKIADFGISGKLQKNKDVCKTSEQCGTFIYMAPEIRSNAYKIVYGSKVDVWSLGISAVVLISGGRTSRLEDLSRLFRSGSLSSNFVHFLYSALDKNPKNRKSAKELLNHPFIKSARNSTWIKMIPCLRSISVNGGTGDCPVY